MINCAIDGNRQTKIFIEADLLAKGYYAVH